MEELFGKICDNSIWVTATPTSATANLPFCIIEAGHFTVSPDYRVKRDLHDSFLLLYTCGGIGCIKTDNTHIRLSAGCAVIIDCHMPHEYYSLSEEWNFLWIHFKGSAVNTMFDVLYPNNSVYAVNMESEPEFESRISELIEKAVKNDIKTCIDNSCHIHRIVNLMYASTVNAENGSQRQKEFSADVHKVIEYIKANYAQSVSIDDMTETIHMSKYHFIRRFSRIMGMTPYSYLMNYRINMSKTLLRTTDKTIDEIAKLCGFMDTSNFIAKFKRNTGQKPLQYRRDFTQNILSTY